MQFSQWAQQQLGVFEMIPLVENKNKNDCENLSRICVSKLIIIRLGLYFNDDKFSML